LQPLQPAEACPWMTRRPERNRDGVLQGMIELPTDENPVVVFHGDDSQPIGHRMACMCTIAGSFFLCLRQNTTLTCRKTCNKASGRCHALCCVLLWCAVPDFRFCYQFLCRFYDALTQCVAMAYLSAFPLLRDARIFRSLSPNALNSRQHSHARKWFCLDGS